MHIKRKKKLITATIIVMVALPFIFFASSKTPWKGSKVSSIAQNIIYPFEYIFARSIGFTSDIISHYIYITDVAKKNSQLEKEIRYYKTQLNNYNELTIELERLRKHLEFVKRYQRKIIPSEIISAPAGLPFQSIRITHGKNKGVSVGMPVITEKGIVGRIIRVGAFFSDVQLISDPNFSVDVLLQRTRVRGILSGSSELECILNLNRRVEIKIGDTLITSGIVGSFPKGLEVGQVKRISYSEDNIYQEITVEPWVNYKTLEEVFILPENDKDFQKISEVAGEDWIENQVNKEERGK